jgi:undecaprenyl-diphosphatase
LKDYLISVLLGIVEGLTEFLPVSSTAHLRIAQAMLGIDLDSGYWKTYAVVIQLGAILSVFVYFAPRIWKLCRTFPGGPAGRHNIITHPLSLMMIAFVVTAVPSLLLEAQIGQNLESLAVIGGALVLGGIVMWVVDVLWRNPRTESIEQMRLWQAVWIGLVQVLSAVFPGTSRSMSTIAAGQMAGMSRPAALEFSFFLSLPTMGAATLYTLVKMIRGGGLTDQQQIVMDAHAWIVLAIGFVVSFVVALGVIAWFMSWVRRRGFVPFAVYRILLGIGILVWAFGA